MCERKQADNHNLCKHALIVGGQGVGKSTLIHRVLEELDVPVCGYVTRKEPHLADTKLGDPIYIYEAGQPQVQTPDNLVGHCRDKRPLVYGEAFDRFAEKLRALQGTQTGAAGSPHRAGAERTECTDTAPKLILMDEVGIMECRSDNFCQAVLELLDGDRPILAAVKYKDRPYLNQVRSHERCQCFEIAEENREELYVQVLQFVRQQLETAAEGNRPHEIEKEHPYA